jgi:anti-anti-sigma regulatory factor
MLKITVHDEPETITMQLEGRVIGPWVREFDQVWRSLADSLGSRRLCIDLREVMQMDADGRAVLAEIHKKTGADFLADTPITKYFAEEAQHDGKNRKEKI